MSVFVALLRPCSPGVSFFEMIYCTFTAACHALIPYKTTSLYLYLCAHGRARPTHQATSPAAFAVRGRVELPPGARTRHCSTSLSPGLGQSFVWLSTGLNVPVQPLARAPPPLLLRPAPGERPHDPRKQQEGARALSLRQLEARCVAQRLTCLLVSQLSLRWRSTSSASPTRSRSSRPDTSKALLSGMATRCC